jgi:hypothetical protein
MVGAKWPGWARVIYGRSFGFVCAVSRELSRRGYSRKSLSVSDYKSDSPTIPLKIIGGR